MPMLDGKRYWELDTLPLPSERVMAERTHEYLQEERRKIQAELDGFAQGAEGGHQRAAIHDSATLEGLKNVQRGRLERIGDLSLVYLLLPRQKTDRVFLG